MSTLIIHPKDRSTTFLAPIYQKIEDQTLVEGGLTKDEVIDAMYYHKQVMMMGHGSSWGLFGVNFYSSSIIDYNAVEALRTKNNNVFIWCNADGFVNKYSLKGLYSGMFISEVGEAMACGLGLLPQEVVTESNDFFAKVLGQVIDQPLEAAFSYVKDIYGYLAKYNPVAKYNHDRLYFNK